MIDENYNGGGGDIGDGGGYNYTLIIIVAIVATAVVAYRYVWSPPRPVVEGFNLGRELKKMGRMFNVFKVVPQKFNEIGKKITGLPKIMKGLIQPLIKSLLNVLKAELQKIPKAITKLINSLKAKIIAQFKSILKVIMNLKTQIVKALMGVINKVKDGVMKGFSYMMKFFVCMADVFKAIASYLMCGVGFIENLPFCMLFYILDGIYSIFIELLFMIINALTGSKTIYNMYKKMEKIILDIDEEVGKMTGMHFVYSRIPFIKKKCYMCQKPLVGFPDFKNMSKCGKTPKKENFVMPTPTARVDYSKINVDKMD